MPLLQSEPVLALGYDQLNSGEVGTEAGHVTRKECQAFRGRVSADVKVWQRRPSLAAASEGWEGWKDGRMEGWKEQPHRDHRALRASFFPAAHEGVKILTLPLLSGLILETQWSRTVVTVDGLIR